MNIVTWFIFINPTVIYYIVNPLWFECKIQNKLRGF